MRKSRPIPLPPNPPTAHAPPKNHTHPLQTPLTSLASRGYLPPLDAPAQLCADTYFTNSPSRPNMKPLNPPPPRWATRTRAQPHGLVHPCRNETTQQRASARHPARPQQHAGKLSTTQGSPVQPALQAPHWGVRSRVGLPAWQPKNDPSAGRAYPRDLRARTLQASDHWHPPGASPTHRDKCFAVPKPSL